MSLANLISVHTPKSSLRLADLGYKTVSVIALLFTIGVILLVDLVPWHSPGGSTRYPVTWIHPDVDPSTWEPRLLPRALSNRRQDDPELIKHIRDNWLLRPADGERKLRHPDKIDRSQYGQSTFYDTYFGEKVNGFYIEAGAYDGEKFSDSLFFEVQRSWDGLLIEADPQVFKSLLKRKRRAYALNACLSPSDHPMVLNFTSAGLLSGITGLLKLEQPTNDTQYIQVQCLPLYSILAAMGNHHVDILFLDVEGAEFDVIQSLSYRDVKIDVINVEVLMTDKDSVKTQRKLDLIQTVLSQYGYRKLDTPFFIDLAMSKIR